MTQQNEKDLADARHLILHLMAKTMLVRNDGFYILFDAYNHIKAREIGNGYWTGTQSQVDAWTHQK